MYTDKQVWSSAFTMAVMMWTIPCTDKLTITVDVQSPLPICAGGIGGRQGDSLWQTAAGHMKEDRLPQINAVLAVLILH